MKSPVDLDLRSIENREWHLWFLTLAEALETKDAYIRGHSDRTQFDPGLTEIFIDLLGGSE